MTRARLELAGGFGTGHAASRVLATNTDTDKEAPGNKHVEHADGVAMPVGTGSQSSEDNQNDGRYNQRVGAGPMVSEKAEEELANDGAGKRNGGQDLFGSRCSVCFTKFFTQEGDDLANNL